MQMDGSGGGFLERGRQLNHLRRYEDALPLLSQAIAAEPQHPEPRCELALALMHLGRNPEGLKTIDAAISIAPQYERGYRIRSLILTGLGRDREALAAAEAAARLAPALPEALYVLGCAQLQAKRPADAQLTAANLAQLSPDWSHAHLLLGQVAIRRKKWKAAEEASRHALRIDPNLHAAHNNLGVALQGQRRTKEALAAYQQASQLDPLDPLPKANMVRLVRPTTGLGLALDLARMLLIPWTIPIILTRLIIQLVQSARRRSLLRPGAQIYYDREWGGQARTIAWLVTGAIVFVIGYIAIAIAQGAGWTFVATGIPVLTLLALSILIAVAPLLKSAVAKASLNIGTARKNRR
jgi:tetratricopeptide (TPR) repeat protein